MSPSGAGRAAAHDANVLLVDEPVCSGRSRARGLPVSDRTSGCRFHQRALAAESGQCMGSWRSLSATRLANRRDVRVSSGCLRSQRLDALRLARNGRCTGSSSSGRRGELLSYESVHYRSPKRMDKGGQRSSARPRPPGVWDGLRFGTRWSRAPQVDVPPRR
jgi:hypothetical protein